MPASGWNGRQVRGPAHYDQDYRKTITGRVRFGAFDRKYRFPCRVSAQVQVSEVGNPDDGTQHPPGWTEYRDTEAAGEVDCVLEYGWPKEESYSFLMKGLLQGQTVATTIDPARPYRGQPLVITRTYNTRESPRAATITSERDAYLVKPGTLRLEGAKERSGGDEYQKWRYVLRWSFRLNAPRK